MDYKRIIPSRDVRLRILGLTGFIPDKLMIIFQYFVKTGRKLNLKKPVRYTEKLQWYKLFYRDSLMTQCADKYKVRKYIASKELNDILVPMYGVYNRVEEIDFDELPNKFVFKTNNGSKTNILCTDKESLNKNYTKKKLNSWITKRTPKAGREWPYYNVQPKIICEKYLDVGKDGDLIDYKFICFSGKVFCVFINADRNSNEDLRFGVYNKDFVKMPYKRRGLRDIDYNLTKPTNYEKMVKIAEKLSEGFPHVRVDLYNINGDIYFGEMTFFHGSGYIEFEPDEFDFILGEHFYIDRMKF